MNIAKACESAFDASGLNGVMVSVGLPFDNFTLGKRLKSFLTQ